MIWTSGFWVVGMSSSYISKCGWCGRLQAAAPEQKMADLPTDRLNPATPFTSCVLDLFEPWYIKDRRKEPKRYGILFMCMASRAIHIEVANSSETDAFINALRRFLVIRGPRCRLWSDWGTNLVWANNELERVLIVWNESQQNQQDAFDKELWSFQIQNEHSFSWSHGWCLGVADTINPMCNFYTKIDVFLRCERAKWTIIILSF